MQESVGFDLEHEPTRPITPSRGGHTTAMIVMGRRRTEYGEAPEAVITLQVSGCRIQGAPVQGLPECELEPSPKRRVCLVIRADVVAVPPAYCTVARVKLILHRGGRRNPYIGGKNGVERASQRLNISPPSFGNADPDRLTPGMHPGIRSARPQCGNRRGAQPPQCLLQNALYGSLIRLALPPAEPGAVVVQHELHGALGHCIKTTGMGGCVKQRCSSTL